MKALILHRSMLVMVMNSLETNPSQPNADLLSSVCSSVSELTVPKTFSKSTGSKKEGGDKSSSLKVNVVRPSNTPSGGEEVPVRNKAAVASQTSYHSLAETARAASGLKV